MSNNAPTPMSPRQKKELQCLLSFVKPNMDKVIPESVVVALKILDKCKKDYE